MSPAKAVKGAKQGRRISLFILRSLRGTSVFPAAWLLALWLILAPAHAAETFTSGYLSEIVADNQHGLKDEDGDRPGWIEIHNGGTAPLRLRDWFLTDDATNRTKWRFPAVSLLPDKYLVVFASGKNRTNDLLHLHTSFRLEPRGGYLALVNVATNVISEILFPDQSTDLSFGRVRGEPALVGPMIQATPGRANASSGPGFAPEVFFSRPSGSVTDSFSVVLSCTAPDAIIRYTLDGRLPTSSSLRYEAPLLVTNTAHLRARAYQEGLWPGPPSSAAYLRLVTNVLAFSSTLPVLVMDTFGQNLPASTHGAFVHLSLREPINGRTTLTNPPTLTTRASFHTRGSTSAGMAQSGYALEFVDEFNQEKNLALLGLPADADWILYAPNQFDPVLIHNPFIHQLSRDLGHYSPRTRFVEVFVSHTSGRIRESHYQGVYVLEEKIKIAPARVNIDRAGADDLLPPKVTGGYLLKFDRLGPGENGFSAGGAQVVYVEPKEQIINLPQRAAQKNYLQHYFDDFDHALQGPNWLDPVKGYRAFLDVDAAVDFHVLEVLSGNVDSMVLSTYFHKARHGKIICGPHWDFDRALGSTDGRDENPRQWSTGPFFGGAWWPRLCSDPDFWQQWADRWQELRGTHFATTNLNRLIDQLADEVREAQPRQYARWGFQPRGGSYQSELDHMKEWLSNRVDFIDRQFTPRPRFDRAALLTLTTPTPSTNLTVYYTLDGSDPRLAGGGVSSNALIYTAPMALATNAHLVARARNPSRHQNGGPPISTPWSGRTVVGH